MDSDVMMSAERSTAGNPSAGPTLSIVVPMYNEAEVLPAFFSRLSKALDGLGESYEVICVNDGSIDTTREQLAAAHARDPRVRVINFARNFGKETALTAGLTMRAARPWFPSTPTFRIRPN